MQEKYCFIVPSNIEAATCILAFKWFTQKEDVSIVVSSENNLKNDLNKINFESFKFVYIVGFYNFKNFDTNLDRKNVYIINKKIIDLPKLKNAHLLTTGGITTLEQFIRLFKAHSDNVITNNQLIFLNNIKNYLTFEFNEDLTPLKLFYYFKTLPDFNKVEAFVKKFNSGVIIFTESENSKINIILKELAITLKSLKLFKGTLLYNGKSYSSMSTFSTKFKNEAAHKILKKNVDIALVLDLEKRTAHFRKNKSADIDLGEFVHKCFSGYGTEYAAFCAFNDSILDATKKFFPINERERT